MAGRTKMAMSSDFLDAFARLPRAQQRGVRSLVAKFNADPVASGLNYEKIHAARDPAMRSLRIDQGYRAIVLKPDRVAARTRRERDAVADALEQHGLPHVALEAGAVDSAETEGVRLATMHRVKGLEFDRVALAGVNADLVPLPAALDGRGDAVERESAETEECALVYVAATRAKKELLVLSYGAPSGLL